MIRYALLIALTSGVLAGAKCNPPPTPPEPPDSGDAGADVENPPILRTPCERACATMERLGCAGHDGAPDGTPCWQVCENQEASGIARFCPEDVAAIESCDELNDAYAACE